tara:strand:- start:718 stop:1428 length:711 start_codon:yes stop_codon:yes gene_type:complete
MATYLNLVNELLRRLNEVEISEEGFGTTKNVQSLAKDSINSSIREILQEAQEWPFTLVTYEQTLSTGTKTYDFPADFSKADWESFYLKNTNTTDPGVLRPLSYEQYISSFRVSDDTSGEAGYTLPINIYKTQEEKFGVTPIPDLAYVVEYKYWKFPADLVLSTDVCVIPDRFKHVIIDGAMMYLMYFRSNDQSAQLHKDKLKTGIKSMRRLVVDSKDSLLSTVMSKNTNVITKSFG